MSHEFPWRHLLGTSSDDLLWSVVPGSSSTEYFVLGETAGILGDQGISLGGWDLFVSRVVDDGSGGHRIDWTRQLGSVDDDYASGLVYDSGSNSLLIAGYEDSQSATRVFLRAISASEPSSKISGNEHELTKQI